MQEYLPRVVDSELTMRLEAFGATLITGPKWCGKTTTGEQQAKSILRMQDPDRRDLDRAYSCGWKIYRGRSLGASDLQH